MLISIDTEQVKQQKYRENRYPIKSLTVPSKTYNKVPIQQYYIVGTPNPPPPNPPPTPFLIEIASHLVASIATRNDDFKDTLKALGEFKNKQKKCMK